MEGKSGEVVSEPESSSSFEVYFRSALELSHGYGSCHGFISRKDFFFFYEATNFPTTIVSKLWSIVNRNNNNNKIGRQEFYQSLQLTTLLQKEHEILIAYLENVYPDLINFDKDVLPKLDLANVPPPHIAKLKKWWSSSDPNVVTPTCSPPMSKDALCNLPGRWLQVTPDEFKVHDGRPGSKPLLGTRIIIHEPEIGATIDKLRFRLPGFDRNRPWLHWDDLPEYAKQQVSKELPLPPPRQRQRPTAVSLSHPVEQV